jgi:hypothetical protein
MYTSDCYIAHVVVGGLMVSVFSLHPRLAGSNLAEGDGFLRATKICSTPSFGGKINPLARCRKILRRVKEPFEI